MSAFGFELRQAARRVFTWKQTGAVLIPAIGLALATIMFAVGWGYSSLSLPYKDADQLVRIGYLFGNGPIESSLFLYNDYQPFFEWTERKDVFSHVAAFRRATARDMTVKTDNGGVQLYIWEVTANFFDMLGVSFSGIQGWKEAANVKNPMTMVFTHKTGFEKFGYESMGKSFPAEDGGNSIVASGILPVNFVLPIIDDRKDPEWAFTPRELMTGDRADPIEEKTADGRVINSLHTPLTVYARLAPGVTPQLAEQMLAGTSTADSYAKVQLYVRPISDSITAPSKPIVRYAWALCALLLVLCAANLGGVLLARCTYHLREYALRSALGASFFNILRTLLIELFGIAVIAALIAAYIARTTMPYIADRIPIKHEAFGRPVFELQSVVFLIAATTVVMFASSLPAIVVIVRNYYKGFSQGIFAVFRSHRTMRIILTSGQTAIATLLLCVCWITVRGYSDIFFRDTGVDNDVRVISVLYPSLITTAANFGQPPTFDILDTLNAFRGGNTNGRAAIFIDSIPLRESIAFKTRESLAQLLAKEKQYMEQYGSDFARENQVFDSFLVSPGFFQTLGVKIIAGRDFNDTDTETGGRNVANVAIVNEAFVRNMGLSPWEVVGRQNYYPTVGSRFILTIIGVAEDFLTGSWDSEIVPEFYLPISRGGIRTNIPFHYIIHPDDIRRVDSIERIIRSADPDARITLNVSWGEALGASVRGRSFTTLCIALFTIAAIIIVVTGIVSTITFIVARRTRDIAIQIAVGAPPTRVCWFVMKDMIIAGVIGALIGGIASWWAGKAVAHYIYNGEKYQNLTGLAIATVIMLAIIAAASLLPALRAIRIEPGRILNSE